MSTDCNSILHLIWSFSKNIWAGNFFHIGEKSIDSFFSGFFSVFLEERWPSTWSDGKEFVYLIESWLKSCVVRRHSKSVVHLHRTTTEANIRHIRPKGVVSDVFNLGKLVFHSHVTKCEVPILLLSDHILINVTSLVERPSITINPNIKSLVEHMHWQRITRLRHSLIVHIDLNC